MFKKSAKTKLDFNSGFRPLEHAPVSESSKNIIQLNKNFLFNIQFNNCFLDTKEFTKKLFPEKNNYNFIVTSKPISTLLFLDLFENELSQIYLFCTRMNKLNKKHFLKYANKTNVFTNDGLSDLQCKKIIICSTHSKALLFQIKNNFYTIIGSGNPSENSKEEQYVIFNNEDIFNEISNICL